MSIVPGKATARRLVYHAMRFSGATALQRVRRVHQGRGEATILVFHTLSDVHPHDGITMSSRQFRAVLSLLSDRYEVLSMKELLVRLHSQPFSGKEVVITFDDGYLDNYELAAPALAELHLPACFYLTAGFIGTDRQFPWDTMRGRRTVMMTWGQARELQRMGFEIGCHTWNHPDLGIESIASAPRELNDAKAKLEDEIGTPVLHFAYPFGGVANIRPDWVDAIRGSGFASNAGCHGGKVRLGSDPFHLARVGCHQRTVTDVRIEIDSPW
jgi:peptidoglycan/xylan/chitin deacetylase (PgdA/CDA1 family)